MRFDGIWNSQKRQNFQERNADLVASTGPVIVFLRCSRCSEGFLKQEKRSVPTHANTLPDGSYYLHVYKFPETRRWQVRYLTYFQGQVTVHHCVNYGVNYWKGALGLQEVSTSMKVWTTVTRSRFPEEFKKCW